MYEALIKEHLKSSLPPGIFWTPYGDFDSLLDAMAERLSPFYEQALATACIRRPDDTHLLNDLTDEYGVEIFSTIPDDEIRMILKLAKAGVKEPGAGDLQSALQSAGFPVQVHRNGPVATNPENFIGDEIPAMVADNETSVADNEDAYAGNIGGIPVLVNGLVQASVPVVEATAGYENMVADNEIAVADYFTTFELISFGYDLTVDDDTRWNQVYFIGGDATRAIDGELIDVLYVDIPLERKNEFELLVLKYGPGEGWAGLFINYV